MTDRTQLRTVGQIREALAAFPDDTPVQIAVPLDDAPDTVEDRYVIDTIGFGQHKAHPDYVWRQNDFLTVECELDPDLS